MADNVSSLQRTRIVRSGGRPAAGHSPARMRRAREVSRMGPSIIVRPFAREDAEQVRTLFIRVNRLLTPPHMTEAFEGYIATALEEEIDQISDYYGRKQGGFWVAVNGEKVIGMFGLDPSSPEAMELRRMYVDPDVRRRGIARRMLSFAEDECRRRNRPR